jgi:hypothetical protein
MFSAVSMPVDAQQRPSHKPTPPAAVPLQPPTPRRLSTQGEHQTEATNHHQNAQPDQHGPNTPPLAQQPDTENPIAPKPKEDGQWYASPHWWTAGFTGALFIATTGLWLFTALLWITTRRAVIGGEDAVKAAVASAKSTAALATATAEHAGHAEQAIRVAEETAERQLRAYVFVAQATITDPDGIDPRLDIRSRNFGQTPAYDVLASGIVRGFNSHDARLFPDPPKDSGLSRFVFGPNQEASKAFELKTLLNGNTTESLRSRGQHILYAWGEIIYRDVFKNSRHTKYRLSIGGPEGWPSSNLMIVSPEGNDAD